MVAASTIQEKKIWQILETVYDPEVPVLTITYLGIVRNIVISPLGEIGRAHV